ncbi:hypothetical protein ACWD6I_16770 [Streptomyces sp. NPDC002454]
MSTQNVTEERFSVALESIQSKRRIERVLEAANALLDRYATEDDPDERLRLAFELIRRNFAPDVAVRLGDLTLGAATTSSAPPDETEGETFFHCPVHGRDGQVGALTARYVPPGPLGLSPAEWHTAMRLVTGIAGLGLEGRATCPR